MNRAGEMCAVAVGLDPQVMIRLFLQEPTLFFIYVLHIR